jgi:hypothetical protein
MGQHAPQIPADPSGTRFAGNRLKSGSTYPSRSTGSGYETEGHRFESCLAHSLNGSGSWRQDRCLFGGLDPGSAVLAPTRDDRGVRPKVDLFAHQDVDVYSIC